jgi:hypothetical protein
VKKLLNPVNLCLLVAVAGLLYAYRPPAPAPSVQIQNASGQIELVNSKNGAAIFNAAGLAPGHAVTGTVQLTNSGSAVGVLNLAQTDMVDNPGAGLGTLSNAVQISIRDVTNPAVPVNVFTGAPSAVGTLPAGWLWPGQSRTYSFTATMPAGGNNAVEGSAMSMRYVWTLTGGGTAPGGGSGSGSATPRPPTGGGGTAGVGSGGVIVSKMPVKVAVNTKKAVKKGLISVTVKCGAPCRLNAYAAAKGKPAVRTRRKSGKVKKAGKKATIKLKLSKAGKKALKKRLAKKKSLTLTVTVKAQDPYGFWRTIKKKGKVKRPKRH